MTVSVASLARDGCGPLTEYDSAQQSMGPSTGTVPRYGSRRPKAW